MASSHSLAEAKKALFDSLGDNFKEYLRLLREWFMGKLDKRTFDSTAMDLLDRNQIQLHNSFLISLFDRCHTLAPKPLTGEMVGPKKKLLKRKGPPVVPRPSSPSEFLSTTRVPIDGETKAAEYHKAVINVSLCTKDSALPDNFAAHLRLFVGVWEAGLDDMQDDTVKLLNVAIRAFVKNLLETVISIKTSGFRCLGPDGRFKYAFGSVPLNHMLTHASHDRMTRASLLGNDALIRISCSREVNDEEEERKITLWDVTSALKKYPQSIPSHAVYSTNLTRIMNKLYHP